MRDFDFNWELVQHAGMVFGGVECRFLREMITFVINRAVTNAATSRNGRGRTRFGFLDSFQAVHFIEENGIRL